MASDIKNTSDGIDEQQKLGRVTVATGGSKLNAHQQLAPQREQNTDIADVHDKYDARFDDPTYYG